MRTTSLTKVYLAHLVLFLFLVSPSYAAPVFVGSWQVDDGPNWLTNPQVFSGLEAAALLFGGSPSDYQISTAGNNPAAITNTAWYSTWGVSGGQEYAHDFKFDLGNPGYNDPQGNGSAISAYVADNAVGSNYTNFAFYNAPSAVPEIDSDSATLPLAICILLGFVLSDRRRALA